MKKTALLLLAAVTGLAAFAQTNTPAPAKAGKKTNRTGTINITADRFDMDPDGHKITMVYTGHVHVDSPDMHLACAKITSYPSANGSGHPDRIVAESSLVQTNVLIDLLDDKGETNHVTGQLADYEYQVVNGATNETVTVTGHPYINTPLVFGPADKLVWDRTTGKMHAINPDFTSKQDVDALMSRTNALTHPTTNTPAAK